MRGYWDRRLMVRAPEGDAGGGGGGNGGAQGGQGGSQGGQGSQRPAWADDPDFADGFDGDRAYSTITNLRRSERDLRNKVSELERQVQDAGKSQTELEKISKRLESMEAENRAFKERERTNTLRGQVADEARKAGAHNPDDIYALLDASALDIEEDQEKGVLKIRNVTSLVNNLKRDKAYLFSTRPADAGAGRSGRQGDGNGNGGNGSQGGLNDAVRSVFGVR